MKNFLCAWLALVLSACTATYEIKNIGGASAVRLESARPVYVAAPRDGAYESKTYPGSGALVAGAVATAFSRHASRVHVAEIVQEKDGAIAAAKDQGAEYLVLPFITHWEHRATEWSGRPSRMAIRLTLVDLTSGEQLVSTSIEGSSRTMSWTSTSPESLLRDPLAEYVDGLYGRGVGPSDAATSDAQSAAKDPGSRTPRDD